MSQMRRFSFLLTDRDFSRLQKINESDEDETLSATLRRLIRQEFGRRKSESAPANIVWKYGDATSKEQGD
jgi:hypothetical protein